MLASPHGAPLSTNAEERNEKEDGEAQLQQRLHGVTPNWKTVRERYSSPGRSIVEGKFG